MAHRLQGKVAIVTGAARGIGAAVATLFAEQGAHVVGLDLEASRRSAEGILNITGDVTRPEQVAAAVASTLDRFAGIDILINNAGANVFAEPLQLSDS
jgi:NAD(P)-dependent dehydrogenase (short-subunit alcohol dehydrogenase family)